MSVQEYKRYIVVRYPEILGGTLGGLFDTQQGFTAHPKEGVPARRDSIRS